MEDKDITQKLENKNVSIIVVKNGKQEEFKGTIHRIKPGVSLGLQRDVKTHLVFAGTWGGIYQIKEIDSRKTLYHNGYVLETYTNNKEKTEKERQEIISRGAFF